jgi:hypothetical protein
MSPEHYQPLLQRKGTLLVWKLIGVTAMLVLLVSSGVYGVAENRISGKKAGNNRAVSASGKGPVAVQADDNDQVASILKKLEKMGDGKSAPPDQPATSPVLPKLEAESAFLHSGQAQQTHEESKVPAKDDLAEQPRKSVAVVLVPRASKTSPARETSPVAKPEPVSEQPSPVDKPMPDQSEGNNGNKETDKPQTVDLLKHDSDSKNIEYQGLIDNIEHQGLIDKVGNVLKDLLGA